MKEGTKELDINLHEYAYKCADGCCDVWGTKITINGVELEREDQDASTILRNVLEHLGYEVRITDTYDSYQ